MADETSTTSAAPAAPAAPRSDPPRSADPPRSDPPRTDRPEPRREGGRPGGGGDRGDRGGGGDRGGPGGRRYFRRKKVDYFSVNKIDDVSYKDIDVLKQFIGDGGKILPRRHTGLSAHHQRLLKRAIKRARNIALLPFAEG